MPEPTTSRHNLMRVVIIVLAVAVVAMAAFVVFLLWVRGAQTEPPAPDPNPSTSPVSEPSPRPSVEGDQSTTTPLDSTPSPATPSTTAVSTATASLQATTTTPEAPTAGQTMMWEGMATFDNITVELLQEDEDQSAAMIDGKAGFLVEVCVMTDVDGGDGALITSASWTLEDSDVNVQSPQEDGYTPPFPTETLAQVGECAKGFLTFDYVSANSDYANLVHDDDLGNRAVWQFH